MADGEEFDDDLFADVYAEDASANKAPPKPSHHADADVDAAEANMPKDAEYNQSYDGNNAGHLGMQSHIESVASGNGMGEDHQYHGHDEQDEQDDGYGPIGIKEDG